MALTLGEEEALRDGTVSEILERTTAEIKKEKDDELQREIAAHDVTRREAQALRARREAQQERHYWLADRWATTIASFAAGILGLAVIVVAFFGTGILGGSIATGLCALVAGLATSSSTVLGCSVREAYGWARSRLRTYFLKYLDESPDREQASEAASEE